MAVSTTRINGSTTQANYGFYLNVMVDDTIQSDNTFLVNIDAYIVNNGSRTNTSGWDKQTIIQGIGEQTDTNQTLNTTGVNMYGGETLAIRHYGIYRVPITTSKIYVTGAMAKNGGYASYDPGYCEAKGWVSMPKVQSTWDTSLLNIPRINYAFELPINKYVSEYYNVVEVKNANDTILVKTINDAVNETSVTFTSSELNTIYTMDNNPNHPLPLVFYMDLKTYTDSTKTTQIGTRQRLKCEAYIVNGEPTATYTVVEQDEKVIELLGSSTSNKVIKNASDLLITITPTALNGATISSIKVNDVATTKSGDNYLINISNVLTNMFVIEITDSRGLYRTYTIQKTLLNYINCNINNWSIGRETQVSSNLVLNANVNVFNDTIDGNTNTIIVKYSIDNENWTTIPSSSYSITDNVLVINNLLLSDIINYKNTATFYLDISDLLSETKENYQIAKGIETYSWGENDLQVNGDIFVADEDGENVISVKDLSKGYTLYDDSTGATNNITLSDNPSNYRYVEIYHKKSNNDARITRIWNIVDGQKATLYSANAFSNTAMEQLYKHIQFNISSNNYTITSDYGFYIGTIAGTNTIDFQQQNDVRIYKVIGYE